MSPFFARLFCFRLHDPVAARQAVFFVGIQLANTSCSILVILSNNVIISISWGCKNPWFTVLVMFTIPFLEHHQCSCQPMFLCFSCCFIEDCHSSQDILPDFRMFCLRKAANREPTNGFVACFTLRIGIYVEDAGNNNDGDISSIRVLKLADASTLGEVKLPPKRWAKRFFRVYQGWKIWVVVSDIFYFHPYLGKWSNLTNIFQMDWNHQLELPSYVYWLW